MILSLDIVCFVSTLKPVTATNMSYVSVVTVWLAGFVSILWFTIKKTTASEPQIDMEKLQVRRDKALTGVLARSGED